MRGHHPPPVGRRVRLPAGRGVGRHRHGGHPGGARPGPAVLHAAPNVSLPPVPLLLARDGRRLSKREHDLDLGALRARGFSGEEIVGRVAYLAGLLPHPRPARPRDLLPLFSWEKVPKENLVLPEDLFRDAQ